jgi:hypothetical protein
MGQDWLAVDFILHRTVRVLLHPSKGVYNYGQEQLCLFRFATTHLMFYGLEGTGHVGVINYICLPELWAQPWFSLKTARGLTPAPSPILEELLNQLKCRFLGPALSYRIGLHEVA